MYEDDIDLIVELADQAAQGAIKNYAADDWRRSNLRRLLDAAVGRMVTAQCPVPAAVVEALDRMEAARTGDPIPTGRAKGSSNSG